MSKSENADTATAGAAMLPELSAALAHARRREAESDAFWNWTAYPCDCWSPEDHRPFCPALTTAPVVRTD